MAVVNLFDLFGWFQRSVDELQASVPSEMFVGMVCRQEKLSLLQGDSEITQIYLSKLQEELCEYVGRAVETAERDDLYDLCECGYPIGIMWFIGCN